MTQKERKQVEAFLTYLDREQDRLADVIRTKDGELVENAKNRYASVTGQKNGITALLETLGYAVNWLEITEGNQKAYLIKYK